MKRGILLYAFIFVFVQGIGSENVIAGTPHTAYGEVFNNNSSVPANQDITFISYIVDRPGEIQTETSTGCGFFSGYWSVAVGSFATAWSVGEVLRTEVTNNDNGETGTVDVVMTDAGSDKANDLYLDPSVPVELSSFVAFSRNWNVILEWSTESETNNFGFEIQRSCSMGNFKKVGFVPGSGTTTSLNHYNYTETDLPANTYYYRLKQVDYDGAFEFSEIKSVVLIPSTDFTLEQNYPNPFNAVTILSYQLNQQLEDVVDVKLVIYNSLGELVQTLVSERQFAGRYSIIWDGRDSNGISVSSGIYISQLIANNHVSNLKMIYMK